MSLEKAIQKLTQVIQAATPAPGTPGPALDSPTGREMAPKNPCRIEYQPGHPSYCFCYKKANPSFDGDCYFQSGNTCYRLTYRKGVMNPIRTRVDCGSGGIANGPDVSPIS